MGNKSKIAWLVAGAAILAFFLPLLFSNQYQSYTLDLIERFPYLAPTIIVAFRFLAVVLAPLPGGAVSLASVAILPWYEAMVWNFLGASIGAITAFSIARKFREPAVKMLVSLEKVHQWQDKISHKKQFWGFMGLRLASTVAFDFVSYAAGLSKITFCTFLISILIVDLPANMLFFYSVGQAIKYGVFILVALTAVLVIGLFISNRRLTKKEVR